MEDVVIVSLDEPLISSSSAATLMTGEAPPYIPGSMLHGLIQASAYKIGKTNTEVFEEILQGGVCVSDAFPLDGKGRFGLPVPLSLYVGKSGRQFSEDGRLHADVVDFSTREWLPGHRQCAGTITANGRNVDVQVGTTTRTAISLGTNRAENGQLFELRFLQAGQRLATFVRPKSLVSSLLPEVAQLGRSKSAEFGTVQLSWSEAEIQDVSYAESGIRYVWFWSDFWPECNGAVALDNLFSGTIDWAHSHVRKRRYSNYNSTRQARTPEREVFTRGSVFRLSNSDLALGLQRMGLAREQGLGLAFVSTDNPLRVIREGTFAPRILGDLDDVNASLPKATKLSQWINASSVTTYVGPDSTIVKQLYESAESLPDTRLDRVLANGGRIARAAASQNVKDIVDIMSTSEGEDNPSWGAKVVEPEPGKEDCVTVQNFRIWLEKSYPVLTAQANDPESQFRALAILARDVRRRIQNERWLEETHDRTD